MIVSMTAFKRPEYTRQALDSLWEASLFIDEPLFLTAFIEPSPVAEQVVEQFPRHQRGIYVTVNDELKGACWNTKAAIEHAWFLADRLGEDFVFHFEDDFVLAPDALRLIVWMRETYRYDPAVFTVGLWHREMPAPAKSFCVFRSPSFTAQGWGMWRAEWRGVEDDWRDRDDPRPGHYRGWDVVMHEDLRGERQQVLPELPRLRHIGEHEGQHTTASIYPKTLPLAFAGVAHDERILDRPVELDGEYLECASP